jgi:hypothetical protein
MKMRSKMRRQINRLSGLKNPTAEKVLPDVIFSQENKAKSILQYQEGAKNEIIF